MSHIMNPKKKDAITLFNERKKHLDELARLFGGWNLPKKEDKINYEWCWEHLEYDEHKCQSYAIKLCGDGSIDQAERSKEAEEDLEYMETGIKNVVSKWFNNPELFKQRFVLNKDPRGYALKIELPYDLQTTIYKDWGGYGILVPAHLEDDYDNED